jgi:glycosyltransferase involved in cell wall biosynthesis
MHIFLNALAAACASGLTYVRNVVPHLSTNTGVRTTVLVNRQLRQEIEDAPTVAFLELDLSARAARRVWFEQTALPTLIRRTGADVLISAGNFALRNSPVPQILLSGNSLYTSSDFSRDLRSRKDYGLWLDNKIKSFFARRSVYWADSTVAPSRTFAQELRQWTSKEVISIYHGFDRDVFFTDSMPLSAEVQQMLDAAQGTLRLLFVSHYNYYRNFETLLRAIPILRGRLGKSKVRLFLTCRLRSENNPGSYRAEPAASLVKRLGISDEVVELGPIPYRRLHRLYKACDVYVTPAYAETFAHPLVEAMASGLPVVASDLPAHREVCGPAALYFQRFSPEDLANQVLCLAESASLRQELSHRGRIRSLDFSWARHVEELLGLAGTLVRAGGTSVQARISARECNRDVQAVGETG